jgi:hypothetical protein
MIDTPNMNRDSSHQPVATPVKAVGQGTDSFQPLKPVQALLTKEVNRTEFLSILGVGALSAVGLGPIYKFLTGKGSTTVHHKSQTSGFGSGPYGV